MLNRLLILCAVLAMAANVAVAQKNKNVNPALAPIEDQPGLPRILLIGDSISIGYTLAVREQLKGIANVHRPKDNCSSTNTGVAKLESWLGEKPWDVIHFNFGLHDLKYVKPGSSQIVPIDTPGSVLQVPLDQYESNLEKIVAKLKTTKAKLIWCSTTPVVPETTGRTTEDPLRYNQVAERVMRKHGIVIDDLYAFASQQLKDIQIPKNVHFTPAGSKVLAQQVAKSITEALRSK